MAKRLRKSFRGSRVFIDDFTKLLRAQKAVAALPPNTTSPVSTAAVSSPTPQASSRPT
jgi:hypothetical protein